MKFRAYIQLNGTTLQVMPRSKKTTLFTSRDKAEAACERRAARLNLTAADACRGIIKNTDGDVVWTIAL